jgi:MoaA/NifB/PqqE/SkfB family radical SAM enzyme
MTSISFKSNKTVVNLDVMLESLMTSLLKHRPTAIKLTAEPGRKYIRIVEDYCGSRSVYCFLDYDGNIYKSASWKAPAKHIRGTVFDSDYSYGKALGPYGAAYLR